MTEGEARLASDNTEVDKQDMGRRKVVFLELDCLMANIAHRQYESCWTARILEDEQSSRRGQRLAVRLVQES